MAALEANPFDDLLSSQSVFVSPIHTDPTGKANAAVDRYGQQPAGDRYVSNTSGIYGHNRSALQDFDGDVRWGWAGPGGPGGGDTEELSADPENEPAQQTRALMHGEQDDFPQNRQHQSGKEQQYWGTVLSPDKLRMEGVDDDWEEYDEEELGHEHVGDNGYEDTGDNRNLNRDQSWSDGPRKIPPSHSRGAQGVNDDDDDDRIGDRIGDNTDTAAQDDLPLPVSASIQIATEPPSASQSFEDQPIRGLAGGKDMSLDELIAQGERQMQEAQDKTASAKAPARVIAPTLSSSSRDVEHEQINRTAHVQSGKDMSSGGNQRGGGRVRHSAELTDVSTAPQVRHGGDDDDCAYPLRSSATANRSGGGIVGDGAGIGSYVGGMRLSGVRTSALSARSASFATSWSGDDPEQLRHLSMGVMPAAGGGDPAGIREEESRNERERREFYELEMELLREEERGADRVGDRQGDRLGDSDGQGEEGDDDGFWEDERDNNTEGDVEGAAQRERFTGGGLGFNSAEPLNAGHVGREQKPSDHDHLPAGAGQYQTFREEAHTRGGKGGAVDNVPASRALALQEQRMRHNTSAQSQNGRQPSLWQDEHVRRREGPGVGDTDRTRRKGEREEYGVVSTALVRKHDAGDDVGHDVDEEREGTLRWEAGETDWASQERSEPEQKNSSERVVNRRGSPQAGEYASNSNGHGVTRQRAAGAANADDAAQNPMERRRTPPPPPPSATANGVAQHTFDRGAADIRYRAEEGEETEEDSFQDHRAWGTVDSTTAAENGSENALSTIKPDGQRIGASHAKFSHSNATARRGGDGTAGLPWPSRPVHPPSKSTAPPGGEAFSSAPSQSKLVQRVFGGRGRRGRGGGRGRGQGGRGGGREAERVDEEWDDGAGNASWAMQAELQDKLRELEEEISKYKEENERARLARRKQETAVSEVMRRRQEVRQWAETERAAVEAWCTEQRQAAAREKRAAVKQIQGLRARAQAGGGSGVGTAAERRQRQEIEGLKATIEKSKLDAEATRKKTRASERRLQQQIKAGAERVSELEGQVSFLERERVDVWASATGNALGGGPSSKGSNGVAAGLHRSLGGDNGSVKNGISRSGASRGTRRIGATSDGADERILGGSAVEPAISRPRTRRGLGSQRDPFRNGEIDEDGWADDRIGDDREAREGQGERGRAFEEEGGAAYEAMAGGGQNSPVGIAYQQGARDIGHPSTCRSSPDPLLRQGHPHATKQKALRHRARREVSAHDAHQVRWEESELAEERLSGDQRYPEHESAVEGRRWRADQRNAPPFHDGSHASRSVADVPAPASRQGGARPEIVPVSERTSLESFATGRQEEEWYGAPHQSRGGVDNHDSKRETKQDERPPSRDVSLDVDMDGHRGDSQWHTSSTPAWGGGMARQAGMASEGAEYDPMRYDVAATNRREGGGRKQGRQQGGTSPINVHHTVPRSQVKQAAQAVATEEPVAPDETSNAYAGKEGVGDGTGRTTVDPYPVRDTIRDDGGTVGSAASHMTNQRDRQRDHGARDDRWTSGANGSVDVRGDTSSSSRLGDSVRDATAARSFDRERYEGKPQHALIGPGEGQGAPEHDKTFNSTRGGPDGTSRSLVSAGLGHVGEAGQKRGSPPAGGGKVEHVLRDGRRIILFANGTQKENLPDGGCVVRFVNGDLKRVEGRTNIVIYTYAAAQTTHTMHPSGLEVFEFPNGQIERHHKTGEKEIDFPDGTRKTILPSGREMSEFPDGVTVVEYPEGHRDVTSPDGTAHRELPDGTVERLRSPGAHEEFGSGGVPARGRSGRG